MIFYKMQNNLSPSYLSSLVPPLMLVPRPILYETNLQTMCSNSEQYYNSFLPSVVHDWNELPQQTRDYQSLNIFKNKLNHNINEPPRYYNVGI